MVVPAADVTVVAATICGGRDPETMGGDLFKPLTDLR